MLDGNMLFLPHVVALTADGNMLFLPHVVVALTAALNSGCVFIVI